MDIINNSTKQINALNAIARSALGSDISGVSVGGGISRIHLLNSTSATQDKAQAVFDHWGGLTVTADNTTITEGDADPVITCADARVASDSEVGYIALLDGDVYAEGTVSISSGEATLNLVSPIAGVYEIFMYRLTGDYASGSVQITVSEV